MSRLLSDATPSICTTALICSAIITASLVAPNSAFAQQKDYFVRFVNHTNENVDLSVTFPQPEFLGTIGPGGSHRWDFSHGEVVEGKIRDFSIGRVTIQSAGTIPIGNPQAVISQEGNHGNSAGGQAPVPSSVEHQVTIWNETGLDVNVMFNGSLHDRLPADGSQGAIIVGAAGRVIQFVNANTLQPLGQHVIRQNETVNFNIGQQLTDQQVEAKVLQLINHFRAENDLPPLVLNSFMSDLARQHSLWLCQQPSVGVSNAHADFDKRHNQIVQNLPGFVLRNGGPQGENVVPANALKHDPANDIVENWKSSKAGHREAMLARALGTGHAGVGFTRINGKAFCTLLMAETN